MIDLDLERELQPVLDGAVAPKPFATVRRRALLVRRRRTARRAAVAISIAVLVAGTIAAVRPHASHGSRIVTSPTAPPVHLTIGPPTTIRGLGIEGMIPAFGSIWASPPGRVVRLDAANGRVLASIPVRGSSDFRNLAAGAGTIWVDDTATQTITRIDPVTNRVVATISIPGPLVIDGFAFLDGKLWVARPAPLDESRGDIVVIDPDSNRIVDTVPAPRTFGLVAGSHALWYTGGASNTDLVRVDTETHEVSAARRVSVTRHDVNAVLAVAHGRLWLLATGGVVETDEATGAQIGDPIPVADPVNPGVAITPGVVWIAGQPDSSTPGTVTPYDIVTHRPLHAPIRVGLPIVTMTVAGSAVWVLADVVTRIPFGG